MPAGTVGSLLFKRAVQDSSRAQRSSSSDSVNTERLWLDFFRDRSQWWDIRNSKVSAKMNVHNVICRAKAVEIDKDRGGIG